MAPDFLSIHSSLRAEILAFVENLNLALKKMDACKDKVVKFMMLYWRVLIARIEEKNSKNHQISIFDFQCVSMNIEG
jgi:hypothetical protein